MSYKIILSESCRKKLKEIAKYIAKDNPTRAISFIDEMQSNFQHRLSSMPLSGREIKPKIRMLTFKRYNIFYQINEIEKKVLVLDILRPLHKRYDK
jgi:toxin ParE1/3/4